MSNSHPRPDRSEIFQSRVVVIGGAGFLGSHLVDYLLTRECEVLVIDNLVSGQRKHVDSTAAFLEMDIQDSRSLEACLLNYRPNWVFNYAAEPYIPECFERPRYFFETNAVGALNVLLACETLQKSTDNFLGLLQVSSAEIYGGCTSGLITEEHPIEPRSTYGASKVAADALVRVRHKESGLRVIALRQFNCVGERETHEYVIPEIISQIHRQLSTDISQIYGTFEDDPHPIEIGPFVNLGNNSRRDFLYAKDAVRMAADLLACGNWGEVYNLGSQEAVQIYDLVPMIGEAMGCPNAQVSPDSSRNRPWEIWHLQSDNTKLYRLGIAPPQVPLKQALRMTVNYFRDNGHKWDW